MKELSIEEKAKRYDEAKARMNRAFNDNRCSIGFMNEIFPEIKESVDTDEKVRKALIKLVTNHASMDLFIEYDIHLYEALAWLEKQGEHKPAWSEEDETGLTNTIIMLKEGASLHFNKKDITKAVDFLRTLKERYTWKPSVEQIKACKKVYADILSAKGFDLGTVNGELNRLEEELNKCNTKL